MFVNGSGRFTKKIANDTFILQVPDVHKVVSANHPHGVGFEHILRSTFSKSFKIIHRKVFIGNKSLENNLGNKYHKPCRLTIMDYFF
jgi:hypothetical protein